jgi:hypothetical protein
LLTDLGLDPDELADVWEAPDLVALPENHSMRGNRVRFRRGATPIVPDERWREGMPAYLASGVQVLTAPVRRALTQT